MKKNNAEINQKKTVLKLDPDQIINTSFPSNGFVSPSRKITSTIKHRIIIIIINNI